MVKSVIVIDVSMGGNFEVVTIFFAVVVNAGRGCIALAETRAIVVTVDGTAIVVLATHATSEMYDFGLFVFFPELARSSPSSVVRTTRLDILTGGNHPSDICGGLGEGCQAHQRKGKLLHLWLLLCQHVSRQSLKTWRHQAW